MLTSRNKLDHKDNKINCKIAKNNNNNNNTDIEKWLYKYITNEYNE